MPNIPVGTTLTNALKLIKNKIASLESHVASITTGTGNLAEAFNGAAASSATGERSHAEGWSPKASGDYSHAEGRSCKATGRSSHAQGENCTASGDYSFASGYNCQANGITSMTLGHNNKSSGIGQLVVGKNATVRPGPASIVDQTGTLFLVGNGTGSSTLSNAFRVDSDGSIYICTGNSKNATTKLQDLLK